VIIHKIKPADLEKASVKKNEQDILARAYAMLQALQRNIAELNSVEEVYVKEYHDVLTSSECIGMSVAEFYVPASEVQPLLRATTADGPTLTDSIT